MTILLLIVLKMRNSHIHKDLKVKKTFTVACYLKGLESQTHIIKKTTETIKDIFSFF